MENLKPGDKMKKLSSTEYLEKLKNELNNFHFVELNDFDKQLNLIKEADVIGFDIDFTLSMYNQKELQNIIFEHVVNSLIDSKKWPPEMKEPMLKDNDSLHEFASKDVIIDYKNGYALKVDINDKIVKAYHGTQKVDLSSKEFKDLYPEGTFKVDINKKIDGEKKYFYFHDSFCTSLIYFFLKAIDLFKDKRTPYQIYRDYYDGIKSNFEILDLKGDFKKVNGYYNVISKEPNKYLLKDFRVTQILEGLKRKGKRLFFATNSIYSYGKFIVNQTISYDFKKYFDLCFFKANKPTFFSQAQPGKCFYENLSELTCLDPNNYNRIRMGENIFIGGCFYIVKEFYEHYFFDECRIPVKPLKFVYIGDHIRSDCMCISELRNFGWSSVFICDDIDLDNKNATNYHKNYGKKFYESKNDRYKYNAMNKFFKEKKIDFALPNVRGLKYIFDLDNNNNNSKNYPNNYNINVNNNNNNVKSNDNKNKK